jgi:hypothetical protein
MDDVGSRDPLLTARALVLRDLGARGMTGPHQVSIVEDAVIQRRWWLSQWQEGKPFVAGLVAQDVQDVLFDEAVRWPVCGVCDDAPEHSLTIEPELGDNPHWACWESGQIVAPLGELPELQQVSDDAGPV